MKAILIVGFLVTSSVILGGCSGKDTTAASESAEVSTYTCPSCKEKISWVYGSWPDSPKGSITARKVVTHKCPSCKKEWAGNLSTTTTCTVCTQNQLACPKCEAHGM